LPKEQYSLDTRGSTRKLWTYNKHYPWEDCLLSMLYARDTKDGDERHLQLSGSTQYDYRNHFLLCIGRSFENTGR